MKMRRSVSWCWVPFVAALLLACGGENDEGGERAGGASGRGGPGGMAAMVGGPPGEQAAVPVEAVAVVRRSISSYIETNGTLEAENDVDIVARVSGPIVQLEAEETMLVRKGQLLARIDPQEIESQLEISRVNLEDARRAYERAERLRQDELVSQEEYDAAKTAFESAQAQLEGNEIQLGYTQIRAPFDGQIVRRYIKYAQNVSNGEALFRLTDFDPLLCPIQVPERNIPQLKKGQRAYLEVEAWPEGRFEASVLRISPVVDAATGTVRVTLEVRTEGRLRPGMFASVFLETETHEGALVIPRGALAIESIGDTVYAVGDGVAIRREVELGVREGDHVEILSGLEEGERVVSVGQDGLSDGTPIQVLGDTRGGGEMTAGASAGGPPSGGPPGGFGGGQRPDLSKMTPEQVEQMKERMRARGMTDEQIEGILKRMREAQGGGDRPAENGSGGN
jgi:RND family efflux transporter MFP subunit